MLLVYLGSYTLFLAAMWWLFIVARMHTYKFKNFSSNIQTVTNILFVIFILLSILGYIIIFVHSSGSNNSLQGVYSEKNQEINLDDFEENYY